MTLAAPYSSSGVTVGTTEISLINGTTTIATNATPALVSGWIDFVNMALGDEYEVAIRDRVYTGGTQRRIVIGTLNGPQSSVYILDGFYLFYGWDVTVTKLAGTDRSIPYSLRLVT